LGGLLLERCGELPSPGTRVVEGRLEFTVEGVGERQVTSVLVVVTEEGGRAAVEAPPLGGDTPDPAKGRKP
jgi:Mg2+/Co2+ transporter CorC